MGRTKEDIVGAHLLLQELLQDSATAEGLMLKVQEAVPGGPKKLATIPWQLLSVDGWSSMCYPTFGANWPRIRGQTINRERRSALQKQHQKAAPNNSP